MRAPGIAGMYSGESLGPRYLTKVVNTAPTNIVGCWPMTDGYGTTIVDIVNARNGTATGITWEPGICKGESAPLLTSGDTIDLFSAGLATALGTGQEFSLAFWFMSRPWGNGWSVEAVNGDASWGLSSASSGQLYALHFVAVPVSPYTHTEAIKCITLNRWHHTAFVVSVAATSIAWYVDGVLFGSGTPEGGIVPASFAFAGGTNPGKINYCTLWNTPLTAVQVKSLARIR